MHSTRVGVAHHKGQGVQQNDEEAVHWFRLAADKGHAPAQFLLGFAYLSGRGVGQDDAEAVRWYRRAADQQFAPAENDLGVMHVTGVEFFRMLRKG